MKKLIFISFVFIAASTFLYFIFLKKDIKLGIAKNKNNIETESNNFDKKNKPKSNLLSYDKKYKDENFSNKSKTILTNSSDISKSLEERRDDKLKKIIKILNSDMENEIKYSAIERLKELATKEAVDVLTQELQKANEDGFKTVVIDSLISIGKKSVDSLNIIENFIDSKNPYLSATAVRAHGVLASYLDDSEKEQIIEKLNVIYDKKIKENNWQSLGDMNIISDAIVKTGNRDKAIDFLSKNLFNPKIHNILHGAILANLKSLQAPKEIYQKYLNHINNIKKEQNYINDPDYKDLIDQLEIDTSNILKSI